MKTYKILLHLFLTLILLHLPLTHASKNLTLELEDANLPDAIRLVANFLDINIILSPSIQGTTSLRLRNAEPEKTLFSLLAAHGLAKWQIGNVWFIAPQEELIKRKEDELKWQEISSQVSPLKTEVWRIRYAKAEDIARALQDEHASFISKRGHVRVDARTNIICIEDTVDRIQVARRLITTLDIPVQQIVIEVRLVSLDSDFERELGISLTAENANLFTPGAGRYSLAVAKLADYSFLDVKLSALENAGHAELISSPRLFTANQQPASIESGEEVPYQEASSSGGTAVVFKKAVLGLKVTPQVLPGNKVLLQLQINQDRPNSKVVLGMPTITTRQITTNVLVKTGQTIVLGGIYETNRENTELRLPFISQIPVLGYLFKRQNLRENKRELLIFVTPMIIKQT